MAGQIREVIVYEADGEYNVYPPIIRLDADKGTNPDQLIVTNLTPVDLVLAAPKGVFANSAIAKPIDAGASLPAMPVESQGNNSKNKKFDYQLMAPKSGKKAKGNSDPVIIIDN